MRGCRGEGGAGGGDSRRGGGTARGEREEEGRGRTAVRFGFSGVNRVHEKTKGKTGFIWGQNDVV